MKGAGVLQLCSGEVRWGGEEGGVGLDVGGRRMSWGSKGKACSQQLPSLLLYCEISGVRNPLVSAYKLVLM